MPSAEAKFGGYDVEYYTAAGIKLSSVPTNAGSYYAMFSSTDVTNCSNKLSQRVDFTIEKLGIDVPKVDVDHKEITYTGELLHSNLFGTVSTIYSVVDAGAIEAGTTVTVTITLIDNNYKWNGYGDNVRTLTDSYQIVKANAAIDNFTVAPKVDGAVTVTYENLPVVSAGTNFGEVKYLYSKDGETYGLLSALLNTKGYLDVGLRMVGTNANFVMWDNATLYYFGTMSEKDALDAMAKIDIQNSLAIADTLRIDTLVMNVDTLANFTKALTNA